MATAFRDQPQSGARRLTQAALCRRLVPLALLLILAVVGACRTPETGLKDRQDADRQEIVRVLFIGNSYTYYNDIPLQIRRMAEEAGLPPVETGVVTAGGAPLSEHVDNPKTGPIIAKGWDVVVLQGHSLETLTDPGSFMAAAERLCTAAAAAGARICFYETWARAAGASVYDEPWSGGSPDAMQRAIRAAYDAAADQCGGQVVPVGTARAVLAREHPGMPLYADDGSHPSPQASHFSACLLFAFLFDRDPSELTYVPWGVTAQEAEVIRDAASASAWASASRAATGQREAP